LLFNAENAENERRGRREGRMGEEDLNILRDLSVFLRGLRVESVRA
jgi:hypothetical protein